MDHIKTRLQHLRERLDRLEIEAFVISAPENRYYLSGFSARDIALNEISGYLVVGRERQALLTDGRYVFQAREECPLYEVVVYTDDPVKVLAAALRDLQPKKVGVEGHHLIVDIYYELVTALDGVEVVVTTSDIIEPFRAIKTEAEIEMIRASVGLTEKALDQVLPRLKPGLSEKQAAWWIECAIRELGAEAVSFNPIVASGPNAAKAHHEPSERILREGEPIILDIGSRLNRYCSDMTRTMVLDSPPLLFKEIYMTVRRAQKKALAAIRPGMTSTEADAVAREEIERAGYGENFLHSLGHGVGLAVHENPYLRRTAPVELKENMAITVEPGIYLEGWGGVRLEQLVVIRKDGVEALNTDNFFYAFD
jgi:Xaa-Pro aminopeptidase